MDWIAVIYCMQIDLHKDSISVMCSQACLLNYAFEPYAFVGTPSLKFKITLMDVCGQ